MTVEKRLREVGLIKASKKAELEIGRIVWIIPEETREKLKKILNLEYIPEFLAFYGGESVQRGSRIKNLGKGFYTLFLITSENVIQIIKDPKTGKKSFLTQRENFDTPGGIFIKTRMLKK